MKKMIAVLLIVAQMSMPLSAEAANYKTVTGRYYDYMCVVANGKEFLLSDAQSKANPYMRWNKKKCYVPIFKDREKVKVTINTRGTRTKKDDRIVSVKKIHSS